MPDKLRVHSGERVDLVDYVHGANTYTSESNKFAMERAWLDRRARVLEGFRIRIEDQTTFPGMITVFNGNALDRDGQLVNNEQTVNDSRSITLLGANLTFYVEIEFVDNESTTDARYFWDPTIANTSPEPPGSEFALNVATRVTPDWRIVTPVSTTGFEQASNADSVRIPLAVFATDGSNRVSTGATNPGLTLVRAASVLEEDVIATDLTLRVLDARVFPTTLPFNVTVDLGAGTSEARTVTALDRTNGICTISVPLANPHNAGAIIQVTSGSAELVREKTDPRDPALDSLLTIPGHPDYAQRFWQADEVRGSAVTSSKETFGSRDDLNIRNVKDYVDFLAAQIRELKFGSTRPEEVNTAPPTTFGTRPRYFDRAGSVQGARTSSVSIGNGTTTFGDFNGTDETPFLAAVAALPSGGTIFVKGGTYSFANEVDVTAAVNLVGESEDRVLITKYNIPYCFEFLSTDEHYIKNISFDYDVTAPDDKILVFGDGKFCVEGVDVAGSITQASGTYPRVVMRDSTLVGDVTATGSSNPVLTMGLASLIDNCSISGLVNLIQPTLAASKYPTMDISCIRNSDITGAVCLADRAVTSPSHRLHITSCRLNGEQTHDFGVGAVVDFGNHQGGILADCDVVFIPDKHAVMADSVLVFSEALQVKRSVFTHSTTVPSAGTGYCVALVGVSHANVTDCHFNISQTGGAVYIEATSSGSESIHISECHFNVSIVTGRAIYISDSSSIHISNSVFYGGSSNTRAVGDTAIRLNGDISLLNVTGCRFSSWDSNTAAFAAISVVGTAGDTVTFSHFRGNQFDDCFYAFNLEVTPPGGSPPFAHDILGCVFADNIFNLVPGIRVGNSHECAITGNVFYYLSSTVAISRVSANPGTVIISGNILPNGTITDVAGGSFVGALGTALDVLNYQ